MDFRSIRQTALIDGINRNPGVDEHNKSLVWDNDLNFFKYTSYQSLLENSKINDGYVVKGDDSTDGSYIWKLDALKNPAWRQEQFLKTVARSSDSLVLTMNDNTSFTVELGALAWADSLTSAVTSVFGRFGDVVAISGDYTAAQVTNAFDMTVHGLDNISEGTLNKHFTIAYRDAIVLNTAARHTHTNKEVLDMITNAGGGIIPTLEQITNWDFLYANHEEIIIDLVVAGLQPNTGITWTYDNTLATITPEIHLDDFTTDNLPEGTENKYYHDEVHKNIFTILLPAASTVGERCLAPIELPADWTIAPNGSGVDLLITHNLTRPTESVSVFSIDGTTGDERLLLSNAAFSGVLASNTKNSLIIEALATITTDIRINVTLV